MNRTEIDQPQGDELVVLEHLPAEQRITIAQMVQAYHRLDAAAQRAYLRAMTPGKLTMLCGSLAAVADRANWPTEYLVFFTAASGLAATMGALKAKQEADYLLAQQDNNQPK